MPLVSIQSERPAGPRRRWVLWAVLGVVTAALTTGMVQGFQQASEMARLSAKWALWTEICDQLKNWPAGMDYPETLSELRLTYRDGGDASILSGFRYQRDATSCTVTTTINGAEKRASFPVD